MDQGKTSNTSGVHVPERAQSLALQYQLVLKPDEEVGFIGTALEMPGVFSHGKTADSCVAATLQAIVEAIETMLHEGMRVPKPSSAARR
jgi:predicted RNase H-like HicB family nuclease